MIKSVNPSSTTTIIPHPPSTIHHHDHPPCIITTITTINRRLIELDEQMVCASTAHLGVELGQEKAGSSQG
jgi:hypothetical protein